MTTMTELPEAHTLRVAACLSVLIPTDTKNGRRPKDPLQASLPGDGPATPALLQVVSAAVGRDVPAHHDGWQTNLAYLRSTLRRWGLLENARAAAA